METASQPSAITSADHLSSSGPPNRSLSLPAPVLSSAAASAPGNSASPIAPACSPDASPSSNGSTKNADICVRKMIKPNASSMRNVRLRSRRT